MVSDSIFTSFAFIKDSSEDTVLGATFLLSLLSISLSVDLRETTVCPSSRANFTSEDDFFSSNFASRFIFLGNAFGSFALCPSTSNLANVCSNISEEISLEEIASFVSNFSFLNSSVSMVLNSDSKVCE